MEISGEKNLNQKRNEEKNSLDRNNDNSPRQAKKKNKKKIIRTERERETPIHLVCVYMYIDVCWRTTEPIRSDFENEFVVVPPRCVYIYFIKIIITYQLGVQYNPLHAHMHSTHICYKLYKHQAEYILFCLLNSKAATATSAHRRHHSSF